MAGCDWVFHEAAQPSVPLSVAQPMQTNRDNLDALLALLVASRDAGVKRFMFASSSAARAGLNYVPEVTWQKGLEHTLDFYRAGNK